MVSADPVNPMRIVWELSERLPSDAVVTADSGSVANRYARLLRVRGSVRGSLSGTSATMGPAVPYAIGAEFAHPQRPAIALTGDGAMQMNGLAELLTIARYRSRWSDQRLVVCVLHNNDLNQVTWELRAMGGAPRFDESQLLPDVSSADFARGLGLEAVTVRDPDELGPAWTGSSPRTGPPCWRCTATRTSRRSRRTPRRTRSARWSSPWSRGTLRGAPRRRGCADQAGRVHARPQRVAGGMPGPRGGTECAH
jgi:pyruvate dehydrogenase (quinone)